MKRWVGIEMCLVLVLLSAMCGGGRTLALATGAYEAFENAYLYQTMPESECLPVLPAAEPAPSQPYDSVTQANLQGRWVHRYQESGVSFEEILTVNGDTARIECYENSARSTVWNGEGQLHIEDRSYRGVCPAVTVDEDSGEGSWLQHCCVYIRWIQDDSFFDGLALNEWVRETPQDPWNQYLYDTVTLDNLQGVWYAEYVDGAGWYQDVLVIDGDSATIFETIDGEATENWNGAGTAEIRMVEYDQGRSFPELIVAMQYGAGAGQSAGIAISRVDEDRFYDALFNRWFVRIWPDEDSWSEGNLLFTIYGNAVREIEGGYAFSPFEDGEADELILDADTELIHPEWLDGYEDGNTAVEWIANLMRRDPETASLSGVYDVDVTGNHIDRVYGLYWWD